MKTGNQIAEVFARRPVVEVSYQSPASRSNQNDADIGLGDVFKMQPANVLLDPSSSAINYWEHAKPGHQSYFYGEKYKEKIVSPIVESSGYGVDSWGAMMHRQIGNGSWDTELTLTGDFVIFGHNRSRYLAFRPNDCGILNTEYWDMVQAHEALFGEYAGSAMPTYFVHDFSPHITVGTISKRFPRVHEGVYMVNRRLDNVSVTLGPLMIGDYSFGLGM